MYNLKNRNVLKISDFSQIEIQFLLDLSADLKKAKYLGNEVKKLVGKNIALIFEKDSTRTRCAFEVAAYDQGAHVTFLGSSGSQMGKKESVKDTARVLGRMYDAIEFRGFSQHAVEELAKYSGVPVYNGLTDESHPTQILADFLTIIEHIGTLKNTKLVYCGDGRNNMANSLLEGAAIMGMDFRICSPKSLFPDTQLVNAVKKIALDSGAKITITDSIEEAVKGADAVYTDVWVSMGENNWESRIKLLKPYQVNKKLMSFANPKAIFLHCLPAFHDTSTIIGEDIHKKYGLQALEVTDEVFESKASVVFDEAENRMHTIKAMMVATLG